VSFNDISYQAEVAVPSVVDFSETHVILKMAVFWTVAPIALMLEAASTSETSVNFYQTTRRNNPEESHLHTRRCENLKSHI
jgi:hypothetical protein